MISNLVIIRLKGAILEVSEAHLIRDGNSQDGCSVASSNKILRFSMEELKKITAEDLVKKIMAVK